MLTKEIGSEEVKQPTHVDEFIDFGTQLLSKNKPENESYARWVMNYFRGSAICKMDFEPFMRDHKLFCDFEGDRYRVTGASRLGDVWLTKDFNQSTGYQKRVNVDDLSNWSPTP